MNKADPAPPLLGFGREINTSIITKNLPPLEQPRTLWLVCTTGVERCRVHRDRKDTQMRRDLSLHMSLISLISGRDGQLQSMFLAHPSIRPTDI